MSEQQNPLERAVDIFVFAPIGVAMFAKDTVPTFLKMFVSRGQTELQTRKKSLSDHAHQYRTIGKFAVRYGGPVVKREAETKLDRARRLAEETFSGLVVTRSGGGDEVKPAPAAASKPKPGAKHGATEGTNGDHANDATGGTNERAHARVDEADDADEGEAYVAASLTIPEYDQLSASQVVERLDGLTPGELDAVRAYELGHRGRNTILGKITQLTS